VGALRALALLCALLCRLPAACGAWIARCIVHMHAQFRPQKEKRHARLPRGVCMFGEPDCL